MALRELIVATLEQTEQYTVAVSYKRMVSEGRGYMEDRDWVLPIALRERKTLLFRVRLPLSEKDAKTISLLRDSFCMCPLIVFANTVDIKDGEYSVTEPTNDVKLMKHSPFGRELIRMAEGKCLESLHETENRLRKEIEELKKKVEGVQESYVDVFNKYLVAIGERDKVQEVEKPSRQEYVYLLKDDTTGMYKIGRSTNPRYRERTLQAEKPSIKQVFVQPVESYGVETEIHRRFSSCRVRGEWFNLTPAQVRTIVYDLKKKKEGATRQG